MKINVPVSIGELVDKITILKIKIAKIQDQEKLIQAKKEMDYLEKALYKSVKKDNEFQDLYHQLAEVNLELWDIEDAIRAMESKKVFDHTFIELARSVYKTNDARFRLKSKINDLYDSEIVEVKEHQEY